MTTTAPPDALERYGQLDEQTAAIVTAAFGTDPYTAALQPADLGRLDAVMSAVVAGREQASAAVATAMTDAEKAAPELPADVPVDTSHLRRRIGAMSDADRAVFLSAWQASGLTTVLAHDGESIILPADQHAGIEALIAAHEPAADQALHASTLATLGDMASGPRFVVIDRARLHGIANVHDGINMTTGRLDTLLQIMDAVHDEAATEVAAALGPVQPGQIVTDPVADVEALANVPPDMKVGDLLAWVGDDTERAALALAAEQRRGKPRTSVLDKLAQMAGVAADPPTAGPPPSAPQAAAPVSAPVQPDTVAGGDASTDGRASLDGVEASSSEPPATVSPADADKVLQSELFHALPLAEWGDLTKVAYLRRIAAELTVAADLIEGFAKAVTA